MEPSLKSTFESNASASAPPPAPAHHPPTTIDSAPPASASASAPPASASANVSAPPDANDDEIDKFDKYYLQLERFINAICKLFDIVPIFKPDELNPYTNRDIFIKIPRSILDAPNYSPTIRDLFEEEISGEEGDSWVMVSFPCPNLPLCRRTDAYNYVIGDISKICSSLRIETMTPYSNRKGGIEDVNPILQSLQRLASFFGIILHERMPWMKEAVEKGRFEL
jgi:hypothetical protein